MTQARDLADLAGAADAGTITGRNLIINGAMTVHQRSGTITAGSGVYSLDRWQLWDNGDGGFDVTQSTEAPAGFKNSLKVDVTSADTAIDAAAYKLLYYSFEGYDMSHLEWGTANAKTVTISFWVRSTTTGDHSVGIRGGDGSNYNSYMTTYNISSANTWEYKTVTIPGDTTVSSYNLDHTHWGTLAFSFATGSTYTVTANETFEAGNLVSATGAVNLFSSASNDWYITGVKLEVGTTATDFEHRSYGEELSLCQRYYHQAGGGITFLIGGYQGSSVDDYGSMYTFPTTMRAGPTATISGTWSVSNLNHTAPKVTRLHSVGCCIYATASGAGSWYMDANSTDDLIKFDAEL